MQCAHTLFFPTSFRLTPSQLLIYLMSNKTDQINFSINQLESLLGQLSLSKEPYNLTTSISNLISGLQSCKQALSAQNTERDAREHWWGLVTKAGEICATFAKTDNARGPIGSSGTIELAVDFLRLNTTNEYPSANVQCLRVLANLCIDNEQNRKRTLDSGGIEAILSNFNHKNNLEILRTASGTLLNAGLEYDPINIEILRLGGLESLVWILEPDNVLIKDIDSARTTVHFTARVILNLIGTDEGKKKFANAAALSSLINLLSYASSPEATEEDIDILEIVIEILEIVALENDEIQQIIVLQGLLIPLLDYLEYSKPPNENDQSLSKKYGEWKAVVLKIVVATTMTDSNMNVLFDNGVILDRFFQWLNIGSSRDDLQICAALSLGNLARNDAHCIKLVQEFNVVKPLIQALTSSAKNFKIQHAVVGLLKNLAIPVSNKAPIGSMGVIELVSPLLSQDTIQPIQVGVVGILKHLSVTNASNSKRIILGEHVPDIADSPKPLSRLLSVIQNTDDISVRSEGTRVLVNLIKNIWSQDCFSTLDRDLVFHLRSRLNTLEVVQPISKMITESKYPLLQNEGIIGLTLLVIDDSANLRGSNPSLEVLTNNQNDGSVANSQIPSSDSNPIPSSSTSLPSSSAPLIDFILAIIINNQEKYPDEMRINACGLLEKAVKTSNRSYKQYFRDHIPSSLSPLLDPSRVRPVSEMVKRDVENLLRDLDYMDSIIYANSDLL
ncbi:hypothetical protein G9A89_012375 [Geosiphon pyriformis]|nr:hypothetical protein G9A89_012375 [Geosiphon pyriformis]